jgi:regulator of protease activity HflC (stomatin/prohibitin superfamily)
MITEAVLKRGLFGWQRKITIMEYERGVLFQRGKLIGLLEPGHYQFWRQTQPIVFTVPLRLQSIIITGQEMLTADMIGIRLTLIITYRITDPIMAVSNTANLYGDIHQDAQLVLREAVTARELEALLEDRGSLSDELLKAAAPRVVEYGVDLIRVGVRDIILPGRMRDVMLLEVEADRIGRADLIRARHETAAARARANTAKILGENPQIARMQEIEALATLAGGAGNLVLLPNMADLFRLNTPE